MTESTISRLFAVRLPTREPDSIKAAVWRVLRLSGLVVAFFIGGLSTGLRAQERASPSVSNLMLQAVPDSGGAVQAPASAALQPQSTASVAGTVRDTQGATVPEVRVTLAGEENPVSRVVTTDSDGTFMFAGLLPGTYRVTIDAPGLEPFAPDAVTLGAGERREFPIVAVRIPIKTTTMEVNATLNQVAQAQVKDEKRQRILGFLPNYYTSYIWNAAPMSRKLKFNLALRTATDPATFLVVAGVAGVEQAHKTFPGYGEGAEGYAKRYGATYADKVAGRMLGGAIFPTLLHQDPRYFYRGSGSVRSRVVYALVSTVVCRGDNARLQPNYSYVLGSFSAAGLSNIYRAPGDRQASLTLRNGLLITGSVRW